MRYNLSEKPKKNISFNTILLRVALVLSILAVGLVSFIILVVVSSNNLMAVEGSSISNVPSNILPSYSTCSFESFDQQTNLSGWFFKCENPISTVIVVHDTASNRLQFGVEMIDLIDLWLENNYNVFLFDLRNCGESEGDISGYGYLEWQDVVGAINQVRMISVTTDVVLYGIGTGCTACVLAYDKLPAPGLSESELEEYDNSFLNLEFDRSYISAMILDSPAKYSDDYIVPIVTQNEFLGELTQYFVPYAIRISSGEGDNYNLATVISRMPIPVCILYGGHDIFIGADKIEQIVQERLRLNNNITMDLVVPGAGYLESFNSDKEMYCDTIIQFLHTYLG